MRQSEEKSNPQPLDKLIETPFSAVPDVLIETCWVEPPKDTDIDPVNPPPAIETARLPEVARPTTVPDAPKIVSSQLPDTRPAATVMEDRRWIEKLVEAQRKVSPRETPPSRGK